MEEIKSEPLAIIIPKSKFLTCLVDGRTSEDISGLYTRKDLGRKSAYYLDKFARYLRDHHDMSLKDYCIQYLNVKWPKCEKTGVDLGSRISGKGLRISAYRQGGINKQNCRKFKEGCDRLSIERKGKGNPMYGKEAWSKGETKHTNPSVMEISKKMTGHIKSEETVQKLKDARKRHPLKARHTIPHSEDTKEILRQSTARLWAEGVFSRVTSIHIKVREFLNTLDLTESYREEYQIVYFCCDFAFEDAKVAIEADGTYYHVDPRVYPNGPINAIQRRNYGRDKAKNKFLAKMGWKVIRLWEIEINDGRFKEQLICKLKEFGLLKK